MKCDICGRTSEECTIRTIRGMNLCPKHITQLYRHKRFLEETIYDPNEYIIYDDHAQIVLKNRQHEDVGHAIIDLDDVNKCKQYHWYMRKTSRTNYAMTTVAGNSKMFLHRYIMDYDGKDDVDHINRNGLDNRKSNLRIVDHKTNMRNQSSDRKGIWKTPNGRYRASITVNYKTVYLGIFDTYEEALEVRLQAEKQYELVIK